MEKVNRFTRINITLELIAIFNLILSMLTEVSFEKMSGVAVYGVAMLIDVLIITIYSHDLRP